MSNLRIGVIGIPGRWSTETLADALEAKTGYRRVMDMGDLALDLTTNQLQHQGFNLAQLNGVVVKKLSREYSHHTMDRLELLRWLDNAGVRVFSSTDSMGQLINRMSCTIALQQAGIAMPKTCITESIDAAIVAVKDYGEAVFKPLFSTKARGMTLISADQPEVQLRQAISDFQQDNPVMYLQQKLALPGQDLGMVFLGGEYQCTYARVSQNDAWNTTINSGGKYASYTPAPELIDLARRAQAPFAMDFTTVDVAESEQGPIVFEVSAFGGFRGALEGASFDAADAYSDYMIKQLS